MSPKTCHNQVKPMKPGGRFLLRRYFMFSSLIISAGLLYAGLAGDPSAYAVDHMTDSLDAVTVSADKGITISRQDTVSTRNTFSLSEALMRNSSLQVNDNGGFSGLKTVSLQGMGSAHTSIYIDGVKAGNVQSGQNDLGIYDISNSMIIIDYAQNSININTLRPVFDTVPVTGRFRMYGGSFGTYLPAARLDFRLSDKLSLSANASGTFSKGDFKYGEGLTRTNNDMSQIRAVIDLFGQIDKGYYHIKTSYNDSERGTPGSTSWPSDDRQEDMNVYLQGSLAMKLSDLYTLRLSGKGSYDDILCLSTWGDSRYEQTEIQLNTSHEFNIKDWWKVSLAADFSWDGLKSNVYNNSRISSLGAIASAFRFGRLSADIALEYCFAFDDGDLFRDALSPSANIRFVVTDGLVISALGRRMYRIPTFNELYYPGYGNPGLKAEDAWTGSISADYDKSFKSGWRITAGISGFYTGLNDKIVSAPTEADPDIWMPYNIGKVRSVGMDSKAGISYTYHECIFGLNAGYSLLSSTDRTPDSYSYGSQVAYTAKHSLVTTGHVSWKGWKLHAAWNLKSGYCGSAGELPDWNTLDLTVSKEFKIRKAGTFNLSFTSRNITDCRYEIISGYPMPGRSLYGGIEYRF